MKPFTFFQIALLIILAGTVYYLVSPKFTVDAKERMRTNTVTGSVEYFPNSAEGWVALVNPPQK